LTSFIGIDMAWKIDGNHSGIAVMAGDADRVALATVSKDVNTMEGIVDFAGPLSARRLRRPGPWRTRRRHARGVGQRW